MRQQRGWHFSFALLKPARAIVEARTGTSDALAKPPGSRPALQGCTGWPANGFAGFAGFAGSRQNKSPAGWQGLGGECGLLKQIGFPHLIPFDQRSNGPRFLGLGDQTGEPRQGDGKQRGEEKAASTNQARQ